MNHRLKSMVRRGVRTWVIGTLLAATPLAPACTAQPVTTQPAEPGAAPADTAPVDRDAGALLDEVRQAVGYGSIAQHPTGFLLSGATSLATLPGRYSFLFAGDRAAVQRIDGPISTVAAINGEEVWITDIGGETLRLTGPSRGPTMLRLLVLSYGYLGDAPMRFQLDVAGDTQTESALAFSMSNVTGRVFIDRGTGLPSRWEYTEGTQETTITLSDYLRYAGVAFPSRVVTSTADGPETVLTIERVEDAPTFIRSPFEMLSTADGAEWDKQVAPELEVVRAPTGHLLVHPRINGEDVGWFIFDTGAGNSVLSTPVVKAMGIGTFGEVPASGVGGRTAAAFCRPDSLRLGGVTMHDPLMVVLDLSFLEQYMGRPIAGLIGYNFLARCIVRLDTEAPAISVHDPLTYQPEHEWTTLVIDQRLPHVEAEFEGHRGLFRLDTGAAQMTVAMHKPTVDRLALLEGRETVDSMSGGVGGAVAMRSGALQSFVLGGHRSDGVRAQFAVEAKGVFADPNTDGNIGGRLLSPFVLVFDYPNQRIAFVPRSP